LTKLKLNFIDNETLARESNLGILSGEIGRAGILNELIKSVFLIPVESVDPQ